MIKRYYKKKTIFESERAKKFRKCKLSVPLIGKQLKKRLLGEKDALILVTGPTGSGKSTLVGHICFSFFEKEDKPNYPGEKMYSDKNFFIDPKEFAKAMVNQKEGVLWLDEAIESVFNRNWNSELNKLIVIQKNKNRKLKNIYFIILPNAKQVDKALATHINYWIHCPRRDIRKNFVRAKFFRGIYGGLASNGLDILKMIEREEKWLKENPTKTIENCPPTIHPEYLGYIQFGKLGKIHQRRYDDLVQKNNAMGSDETLDTSGADKVEIQLKQENIILDAIKELNEGKIQKKKELWDNLKLKTGLTDSRLEKMLNRQLDINGFTTFKRLRLIGDVNS